jgi:hypothetical protein
MRRKIVNRESGRRVSQESDYVSMMKRVTDKAVFDQMIIKHSEYKKPYMSKDYSDMEYDFAAPYGITPGAMGAGFDFPWMMGGNMVNLNLLPMEQEGGAGAGSVSWAESCAGVKIAFTSQQMNVGEEQSLHITGGGSGAGWDWEITSGGGSLSTSFFSFNTYTAPATNVNCADNPTIKLKCNGKVVDTLKMAINGDSDLTADAVQEWSGEGCLQASDHITACYKTTKLYACDGSMFTKACSPVEKGRSYIDYDNEGYWCTQCLTISDTDVGCGMGAPGNTPFASLGKYDLRTTGQKAAGCCPSQLL